MDNIAEVGDVEKKEPCKKKTNTKGVYKRISLYSAETGKTKCVQLRKANFATPEELEAYANALKEEQKQRNAQWKQQKLRGKLDELTEKIEQNADAIPHDPKNLITPLAANLPPVSSDVNLNLDQSTGNTIVIYGSSKRGKTTLMMYLYMKYFSYHHDKSLISTLFSGNPQLKTYRQDSKLLVGYGFNDASEKYVQLQQYINVKTKNRYKFLDMFDDIIEQKHSRIINRLILTYRNSAISTILCLQYVKMLSKSNRASVNHTFVFGSNTAEDEKNIIDTLLKPYLIAAGMPDYKTQVAFYRAMTADHGFIYLDNVHCKMTFHRLGNF